MLFSVDELGELPVASRSITEMLAQAGAGDRNVMADLFPLVYAELREIAARNLRNERAGHTLQPTALVHEAYLRLVGADKAFKGRAHFLAAAATAMRRVLVDHARARAAAKRGAAAGNLTLCGDEALGQERREVQVLELNELIGRLALLSARKAQIVELKFFAGMTNDEIAAALDISRSVVADDWAFARAWLSSQWQEGNAPA